MARKLRKRKITRKLLDKYRLVILNESTFEERFSIRLNRLNVFVFGMLLCMFLIAFTIIVIAYTPLREYIPGYSPDKLKMRTAELNYRTDSLQRVIINQEKYLDHVRKALIGEFQLDTLDRMQIETTEENRREEVGGWTLPRADSLLREQVAQEDRYSIFEPAAPGVTQTLFPPVQGAISQHFNIEEGHFAVDITTDKNSPVKAAADGTVIFAEWSAHTGHVIILEHTGGLISVYKHNASLNKTQGETVKAGEVIAMSGSGGDLSTGPHLHFELWSSGYPVNPAHYIEFRE